MTKQTTIVVIGSLRSYCYVWWVLSSIVITSLGEKGAGGFVFSLVCNISVVCHGLFTLCLGVIGRQQSVIVTLPGLCYFTSKFILEKTAMTILTKTYQLWEIRTHGQHRTRETRRLVFAFNSTEN